jgi:hypothetical protein
MPKPEGLISISSNCDGLAFSNPCASRGEKLTSSRELRWITTRPVARSYCAAIALGTDARIRSPRRVAISNLSYPAMNVPPRAAQRFQMIHQNSFDLRDLSPRESVVLPDLGRPRPTVQVEYRFTTSSDHMHMSRPVIIRINHSAQSIKSQNCRHIEILSYPKRLGFVSKIGWSQCELPHISTTLM